MHSCDKLVRTLKPTDPHAVEIQVGVMERPNEQIQARGRFHATT